MKVMTKFSGIFVSFENFIKIKKFLIHLIAFLMLKIYFLFSARNLKFYKFFSNFWIFCGNREK